MLGKLVKVREIPTETWFKALQQHRCFSLAFSTEFYSWMCESQLSAHNNLSPGFRLRMACTPGNDSQLGSLIFLLVSLPVLGMTPGAGSFSNVLPATIGATWPTAGGLQVHLEDCLPAPSARVTPLESPRGVGSPPRSARRGRSQEIMQTWRVPENWGAVWWICFGQFHILPQKTLSISIYLSIRISLFIYIYYTYNLFNNMHPYQHERSPAGRQEVAYVQRVGDPSHFKALGPEATKRLGRGGQRTRWEDGLEGWPIMYSHQFFKGYLLWGTLNFQCYAKVLEDTLQKASELSFS